MRFDAPTGNVAGNILAVVDVSCGKSGRIALAGIKRGFSGRKFNVRGDGESCACVGVSIVRCRDLYSRGIQAKDYRVIYCVDGCLTGRSALVNGERNAGYRRTAIHGGERVASTRVKRGGADADSHRLILAGETGNGDRTGDTGSERSAVYCCRGCDEGYILYLFVGVVGNGAGVAVARN